jgi:CubicO group peptidase (beta-lactamase class C family)
MKETSVFQKWIMLLGLPVMLMGCGEIEPENMPDVMTVLDVWDTDVTDVQTSPDVEENVDIGTVLDVEEEVDVVWQPTEKQSGDFELLVVKAASLIDGAGIPGGAIGVVVDGHAAFGRGMGYRNIKTLGLVTEETLFQLMSVSKMFVAATAMSLVDEGTLDMQAPLTGYAPFLQFTAPYTADSFTAHQLFTHTSGLGTMLPMSADLIDLPSTSEVDNLKAFLEALEIEVWAPPGTVWLYSNFGYVVAALVVEEMAGQNLFDAAAERVFVPAGMETATFYPEEAVEFGATDKHSLNADGELFPIQTTKWDTNIVYAPMAGMYASVNDLTRWAELLMAGGEGVLSEAAIATMMEGAVDMGNGNGGTYGYGWVRGSMHGVDYVMHNGAGYGYASQLLLVPEHEFAIVALVNADLDFGIPHQICVSALEIMLGEFSGPPPDPIPMRADLEEYEGTYVDPFRFGEMVIEANGNALVAIFPEHEAEAIFVHLSYDTFVLTMPSDVMEAVGLVVPAQVFKFFQNEEGVPTYLTSVWGVATRQVVAQEDAPVDASP